MSDTSRHIQDTAPHEFRAGSELGNHCDQCGLPAHNRIHDRKPDLVTFIRARLAEREALAQLADRQGYAPRPVTITPLEP
jgi:hypothetical protein